MKVQLNLIFILFLSSITMLACGKSNFNAANLGSDSSDTPPEDPSTDNPNLPGTGGGGGGGATKYPYRFISKDAKILVDFSSNYAMTIKKLTSMDGAISAQLEVNRTSPTKK